MRARTIVIVALGAMVAWLLWASPAGAQDEDHAEESVGSTTSIPDGIGLDEGIFVTGAVVTPLDGGEPTTMSEYHAATFTQSWLGAAFFGAPGDVRDPPPDLPVYRVDIAGTWAGSPGNVTAYYATDGTTAYIGFPGITVWTDPAAIPPPSQWFVPPPRVIDAFNGSAELVDTSGRTQATATPGTSEEEAAASGADTGDESSSGPWPWVAGAVIVVGVASGFIWLRRRRTGPPPADTVSP